jgi:hypothetical protein
LHRVYDAATIERVEARLKEAATYEEFK